MTKLFSAIMNLCGMISAMVGLVLTYQAVDMQSWRNAAVAWILATLFTVTASIALFRGE